MLLSVSNLAEKENQFSIKNFIITLCDIYLRKDLLKKMTPQVLEEGDGGMEDVSKFKERRMIQKIHEGLLQHVVLCLAVGSISHLTFHEWEQASLG